MEAIGGDRYVDRVIFWIGQISSIEQNHKIVIYDFVIVLVGSLKMKFLHPYNFVTY